MHGKCPRLRWIPDCDSLANQHPRLSFWLEVSRSIRDCDGLTAILRISNRLF
jgi:hypothetical protein